MHAWARLQSSGGGNADVRARSRLATGAAVFALLTMVLAGSGQSASARSGAVLPPYPALDSPPVVSGVPQEGLTLTTTNGGWTGTTPMTYSYQWQRCQVANDVANPSFETDLSGWTDSAYAYGTPGGITMTRVTDRAHAGSASLRIDTPGYRNEEGVRSSLISVTPGLEYRFITFVYSAVAGPMVEIVGLIGGPAAPTGEVSNRTPRTLNAGWNRISVRLTAPGDATWGTVWVETQSNKKQAVTYYVDDVLVTGCSTIAGATGSSYTVVAADAGYRLSSVVDAHNSAGSASFGGTLTDEAVDKWSVAPAYTGPVFPDNSAAAASDPPAPPPIITTLPTWRNLYDWPNGHGYVGWHFATSAPDSRYGNASNLGGNSGLWLWPVGGQRYDPNYAEWTYTAPGTTRLSTAKLTFAYRNKLLAHHCIEVGFRTLDGTTIQEDKWCKPALPPDSQREVQVSLADPKNDPTAKVLYFRVELPPCNGGDPCEKWIPTLDPLTVGGYARLEFADMILVDDDNPVVTPSGPFFDLAGQTIRGDQTYALTLDAVDAGSGITRVWLEQNGSEIASVDAPCDPTHHTPALDNRICPAQQTLTTNIDTTALADGIYTYVGKAKDVAGNVGESAPWSVAIDRSTGGGGGDLSEPFPEPTLTPEQVAQAIATTENDSAFNTLVAGRGFSVAATEAWSENAGPTLIGAVVAIQLDVPASIDGMWPQVSYADDGSFTTVTSHYSLRNVTTIDSYVNLTSGTVAGLDPSPEATWANAPQPVQARPSTTPKAARRAVAAIFSYDNPVRGTPLATATEEEDTADVDTGRGTNGLHLMCTGTSDPNCFMNYDFSTSAKDENRPAWNKVDWPVTVIWTGQSNINKVKAYLEYELSWFSHGSSMAAVVEQSPNGSGRVWDTDKGKKENLCTWHFKTPHTRLYADPTTDTLFSLAFGNYVLGTTHFDWAECTDYLVKVLTWPASSPHISGAGYSEAAERFLVRRLRSALSSFPPYARTTIYAENLPLLNAEHFTHGSHHADNDGVATLIKLGPTN